MSTPPPSSLPEQTTKYRILGTVLGADPDVLMETDDPVAYRRVVNQVFIRRRSKLGRPGYEHMVWSPTYPNGRKFLTNGEMAGALGISPTTIHRARRELQRLPPPGHHYGIPKGLLVWACPGAFFCTVRQFDRHFSTLPK